MNLIKVFFVGTIITCDFDFSPDWRSYYDSRPESFGHGKDLVIYKGFREKKTTSIFERQLSDQINQDLSGMIFEHVMKKLLDEPKAKQFR